jgi:hypothetical protein
MREGHDDRRFRRTVQLLGLFIPAVGREGKVRRVRVLARQQTIVHQLLRQGPHDESEISALRRIEWPQAQSEIIGLPELRGETARHPLVRPNAPA